MLSDETETTRFTMDMKLLAAAFLTFCSCSNRESIPFLLPFQSSATNASNNQPCLTAQQAWQVEQLQCQKLQQQPGGLLPTLTVAGTVPLLASFVSMLPLT